MTAPAVTVRSLHESGAAALADDEKVRRLFARTLLLGEPLPFPLSGASQYQHVCLGWYLGAGRADAGLAIDEAGQVLGYALVCTDGRAHARWSRRHSIMLATRLLGRLLTFRLSRDSRRFYAERARDSLALWRGQASPPMPVHAHLNIDNRARSGSAAVALRDHIDERCRRSGQSGWFGEMNAREGTRERAVERIGLQIVHRKGNHTLSTSLGRSVVRLTVVRRVPIGDRLPIGDGLAGTAS